MARFGATYNTINSRAVWQALHRPGRPVYDYVSTLSHATMHEAIATSPVNNPLNAGHRGGVVGTYKASWHEGPSGSNQFVSRRRVWNSADHAGIVEKGKPYVRKRQVFTWEHAWAHGTHRGTGRKVYVPRPGGIVSTKVVHAWGFAAHKGTVAPRGGHRTLENALQAIASAQGHRRGFNVTINH